ncbi:uncharacterized protein BDR25DRAFT_366598 [Lindgomyces ingoldianus]|uniref:Uncharacterized protein n=1 Tax=Lindgomyces ingoldianus TaxID=673940 RepID=A0ACB6QZX6_9PLEO|nr:uncharacterized protein BDR25DRAFT_366598 [Lindgomyces ingoldianus]KAF2472599.1 hypothetical protein BDR25DRAFT_366598 [Lindgomyces ingoldianus]
MEGSRSFPLSWWKDHIDDITIQTFAAGVGAVVEHKILARDNGTKLQIDAAIRALKEAEKKVDKAWLKNLPKSKAVEKILSVAARFPKISAFLGGTIVSVLVSPGLEVANYLVKKDDWIRVQVYNFDKRDWTIDDWYHDNGIIAGGSAWEVKTIPAGKLSTPKHALTSNRLTIRSEYPTSIKDFYDDEKNWPHGRPQTVKCEVTTLDGSKVNVTRSTKELAGVSGHI